MHVCNHPANPALPSCPEFTVRGLYGFIPEKSRGLFPLEILISSYVLLFFWHKIWNFKICNLLFIPNIFFSWSNVWVFSFSLRPPPSHLKEPALFCWSLLLDSWIYVLPFIYFLWVYSGFFSSNWTIKLNRFSVISFLIYAHQAVPFKSYFTFYNFWCVLFGFVKSGLLGFDLCIIKFVSLRVQFDEFF